LQTADRNASSIPGPSFFIQPNFCDPHHAEGLADPGHILFLRILYHIPYHGQKNDIISYHISRKKIGKGYISYILSNFILASKTQNSYYQIFFVENILYVPSIPQQIQISVDQPYTGPAASCCVINMTHSTTFLEKSELWTEHKSATNVQSIFLQISIDNFSPQQE
jgi:hypothetical protein